MAAVGMEQHTPVVDGGDGADGAVDERGVAVTVSGVEQHPIALLVVAIGCPSRTGDRGPGDRAGGGKAAADPVGEVFGLGVGHNEGDRSDGTVSKYVGSDGVGHRPAGVFGCGGGVFPSVLAAQLL